MSVTRQYCVWTAKIPTGTPLVEALNTWGWEKWAIFDWNHSFSRKQYKIGLWLLQNVNRNLSHRWRIDTCLFRWPWVTLIRVSRSLYIYKSNISKTVHFRDKVTIEHYRKPYTLYRMVQLSMTLSDLWPRFQGHDIFRHWISQKRHETEPYLL